MKKLITILFLLISVYGFGQADGKPRYTQLKPIPASHITDFQDSVSVNTNVLANSTDRHVAVTLAGAPYLSLSTQEITAIAIDTLATNINLPNFISLIGVHSTAGATQLSDLSDVNTSTPTNRNVLVADGIDWESRALVEADISDLGSYQPLDAGLTSISALTTLADRMIYTTASDVYAVTPLTSFGRSILDDADQATVQSTLNVDPAGTDNSTPVTLNANAIAAGLSLSTQELNYRAATNAQNGYATASQITLLESALQTEVDGSITNELQTIANTSDATSHTVTLSDSGGSVKLAEGSNITLTTTGTSGDGVITIASTAGGTGTVTSVTAGNGMTQTGTSTVDPTLNVVSHAGSAGTIGTIDISADAIGVDLGTTSITAYRGDLGNTAYTDRLKWDGGNTDLVAATGRTSLNVDVAGTDNSTNVTLNASATTGGMSISTQEISNRAATNAQTGYMTAALVGNIETNNDKVTNSDQDLSYNSGTHAVDISDGNNAVIPLALADGATEGLSSFTAADFNATAGNISIDYTNAQKASTSVIGFLTNTDWNTFNNKTSNAGTVTSAGFNDGTGFTISGTPITSSGSFTFAQDFSEFTDITESTGIKFVVTDPVEKEIAIGDIDLSDFNNDANYIASTTTSNITIDKSSPFLITEPEAANTNSGILLKNDGGFNRFEINWDNANEQCELVSSNSDPLDILFGSTMKYRFAPLGNMTIADYGSVPSTPAAGYGTTYINNKVLYFKDEDGGVHDLTSGGSSITIGSDNQVPISNSGGTDFDYDANFIFDNVNDRLDIGAFGTPITVGSSTSFSMLLKQNVDNFAGFQMYNANTGTSADFRFLIANTDKTQYLTVSTPGNSNTATFFEQAKNTANYMFNVTSSGSLDRDLIIGTFSAGTDLKLGAGGSIGITLDGTSGDVGVVNDLEIGGGYASTGITATSTGDFSMDGNLKVDGIYYDSSADAGTSGQILSSTATGTNWITPNITDGNTAGQLAFWDGSTWTKTEVTELFWDDTNKRLSIGENTPNYELSVNGTIRAFDDILIGSTTTGITIYNSNIQATTSSTTAVMMSFNASDDYVDFGAPIRFDQLSADPTTGVVDGMVYYNITTDKLRLRANGAWVSLN